MLRGCWAKAFRWDTCNLGPIRVGHSGGVPGPGGAVKNDAGCQEEDPKLRPPT